MFFLKILRYLRGFVWFEVRGTFVERFLNLVARDSIAVWGGKKSGDCYTGCIAARNYKRLRTHAKKTGVRLRIVEKNGAPFQRRKYRNRNGLFIGIAVFFAFIFIMSRFVWRIEVNGNERIDNLAILQALEKLEITPGTYSRGIDIRDSERKLQLLVPDLSWAALNLDGSTLRVEVSESILPPPMVDPNLPCNIVAAESGQILSMNVFSGQTLVEVGDTVLAGDIIVSGITRDRKDQSLYRHSRADVYAETIQTIEIDVPFDQSRYTETGTTRARRYLGIFGVEVPFFLPRKIPLPYRVEREQNPVKIFSLELPLFTMKETYHLMDESSIKLSESECKDEALLELKNMELARFSDAKIISREVSAKTDETGFHLKATYICHMNIALEKPIAIEHSSESSSG